MKDQLISFETAKLAKGKGFPQNQYEAAKDNSSAYYPEFIDGTGNISLNHALFNIQYCLAIAPTQSLLQKWLREKRKLIILPLFNENTEEYYCRCVCKETTGFEYYLVTYSEKKTYEEALEIGLQEALKLIP
jgi:hypothetical protein